MTKLNIMTSLSRTFGKAKFTVKKHSPEILITAGVVGTVTSAVLACKATLKVNEVLEESKETIEKIHTATELGVTNAGKEYTEEDSKKELTIVYAQTGIKLVKLYAPAVVLGALSITAIVTSNNIQRKRNIALASAYATLDSSFKGYRSRVIERFGEDLDRELKYNIKAQEVEEVVVNEDGSETVTTKTVNAIDPSTIDDTSRIWYEGNPGWSKDPEYNLMYLKKQQSFATKTLQLEGHLFLNDVYEMLGFPKTAAGQVLGWIYDEKNPVGDNFVDFGIYDINNTQKANFVNGHERSVLLEFNHDGNILKYINPDKITNFPWQR